MKSEDFASWQESYDKPESVLKSRHNFANKRLYSQDYGLPSGHIQLWEPDCKEGGAPKNRCPWTVVLEKMPESFLDRKEIKPINLKGNLPRILVGRTDTEAETSVLWSSLCEQVTHWKSPWCWERLKAAGKEGIRGWDGWMASRMQWTWTWANFGRWWGTGGLVCYSPWGHKESDTAGQLNNSIYPEVELLDLMDYI